MKGDTVRKANVKGASGADTSWDRSTLDLDPRHKQLGCVHIEIVSDETLAMYFLPHFRCFQVPSYSASSMLSSGVLLEPSLTQ
jgi:hypothetical protein